ncbi:MAG: DUF4124 domain-containing protein [Pseudomonadota bacterium]
MDFRHILVLAVLFFSADAFAQAYRWVDDDGVVHYSDTPRPGAQEFELPKSDAPAQPTRPRSTARASERTPEPEPQPESYTRIGISAPAPEATLWNIGGVLNVQLELTPRLQPGHKIRVYLDGEARDVYSLFFPINEVWRGEHTIQVEVLDRNDEMIIRSDAQKFYVQQTSVLTGAAPRAPGAR